VRKLFWDLVSTTKQFDESVMVETAWRAYEQWWKSSDIRSEKPISEEEDEFDDPLHGTGISLGSP
jgi:hypothetical protein